MRNRRALPVYNRRQQVVFFCFVNAYGRFTRSRGFQQRKRARQFNKVLLLGNQALSFLCAARFSNSLDRFGFTLLLRRLFFLLTGKERIFEKFIAFFKSQQTLKSSDDLNKGENGFQFAVPSMVMVWFHNRLVDNNKKQIACRLVATKIESSTFKTCVWQLEDYDFRLRRDRRSYA